MIPVLLADNQPIFRAGTARVLGAEADMTLAAQCDTPATVLDALASSQGAVMILAQSLGANLDRVFAAAKSNGNRIILMMDTTGDPPPAILAQIDGLINRHIATEDLLQCIRAVSAGERALGVSGTSQTDATAHRILQTLTQRELQIVGCVVQGMKNRKIADKLGTGEQVVKNYLRSIYDKTGSSDRLELALFTLHHRPLAQAAAQACAALGT